MLSHTYALSEPVTIVGKPFHGWGIDHLTLHPGEPGSGIQFRFEGKDYSLGKNLIQAKKERTARFNEAMFDTFKVKVLEHWQSAIVQALGFFADVTMELPKPKLFYQRNILLPYAGAWILTPHSTLIEHRKRISQDVQTVLGIDWNKVKQYAPQGHHPGGIRSYIDEQSQSITFTHPSGANLRISTAPHLRTTVHSANHPDVPALKHLNVKPYTTDYTDLTIPELSARALGRTGKLHQRLGANILRATWWYGISCEGYFFATPGISPQTLNQSMQASFQSNANEHLVHSAVADIPAELWIVAKHFQAQRIGLHMEFRDSTHISRVALLRTLCETPYMKTNTIHTTRTLVTQ